MPICSIDGCGKPRHGLGYCNTHYLYFKRTGKAWTPEVGQQMPMGDKFWPKVDVRGPNECWNWKACLHHVGYGLIGKGGYRAGSEGAHRVSYRLNKGPIPSGLLVMHTCDNRRCVNPAHLRLGTHKENTDDMMSKGRHWSQKEAA